MSSDRFYRWLLKLYPSDFHDDYAAELASAFRNQCLTQGAMRTWIETVPDIALSAWSEHMDLLRDDLRYSLRLLSKSKLLTLMAVLSVSLGIGSNSTMFSIVYASVLRPFGFHEEERLVLIWSTDVKEGARRQGGAVPDILDFRKFNASSPHPAFERIDFFGGDRYVNLQSDGAGDRAKMQYVSQGLFPMLGLKPYLGRFYTGEELRNRVRNAVVSYGYWQRRFGGDPRVLGKTIHANGAVSQVIGVTPPEFSAWDPSIDIWLPHLALDDTPSDPNPPARKVQWQLAVGRLRQGVTIAQAQTQLDAAAAQLASAYPSTNLNRGAFVEPFTEGMRGYFGNYLFLLFGAVAFVLLIACTNVTNLLLARAATRRREFAVRAAIGASRGRIMRQLLSDGMVLAIPAGLLGLVFARLGISVFVASIQRSFPEGARALEHAGVDSRVLLFTFLVSVAVGILLGFAPAIQFSRPDCNESLKEGGRGSGGSVRQRTRSLLVVGQVALAGVLLTGSILTLNALTKMFATKAGFQTENLVTMHVHLSGPRYVGPGPKRGNDTRTVNPKVEEFYAQLLTRVRAIPGVKTASVSSWIPFSDTGEGMRDREFEILDRPTAADRPHPRAWYNMVSPEFLEALQIPLRRGRFLQERDIENAPWVAVINESLARKMFPGADPIGKQITMQTVAEERPRTIVGIIGDIREYGAQSEPWPEIYVSFLQQPAIYPGYGTQPRLGRQLSIRSSALATGITEIVQRTVRELDAGQMVFDSKTMQQRVRDQYFGETFLGAFLSIFSLLAVLLASIGIYGVISYTVAQRSHEIGIRLALGADRGRILRMVLGHGMRLTVAGLFIAALASYGVGKLLGTVIAGAKAGLLEFLPTAFILLLTAVVATGIPGRRAAALDPARTLRNE